MQVLYLFILVYFYFFVDCLLLFFLWVVSTCVLFCLVLLINRFSSLIFIYLIGFYFMQESSKTLASIIGSLVEVTHILRPTLHEESWPMFNSNQAFLFIHAKVKISPKGLLH
jgi:hypothetical protein